MLSLKVIQQLIKESDLFKQVYIGKLDNKKEKSLGIYHRKSSGTPIKALGGLQSKYKEFQIGDTVVRYLSLAVPEPQDVGTDDNGVYEFVIWIDVIYERK